MFHEGVLKHLSAEMHTSTFGEEHRQIKLSTSTCYVSVARSLKIYFANKHLHIEKYDHIDIPPAPAAVNISNNGSSESEDSHH